MAEHTRVLIVGSGPAGLTAAIYSARAQLRPIVIEGEPSSTTDQPGGQLMLTTDVENFPGFPEAISGPDLMMKMRDQAIRFGADLRVEKVHKLDTTQRPFRAWLGGDVEPSITADAVILATGARSLMLNVPGEERYLSHGLSTCATCDGFFFRGQDIAVIGGGDSALEEALFLTRFASTVTVIHRRDSLRASKIMQERAFAHEKIRFEWNTQVTEVIGDDKVMGLKVRDTLTDEERVLARHRGLRRHRPRAQHDARHGPSRPGAQRLRANVHGLVHQHRRPLRRRRRPRRRLPPGRNLGGLGLHCRH